MSTRVVRQTATHNLHVVLHAFVLGAVLTRPCWGDIEGRGLLRGAGHQKNFVGHMFNYMQFLWKQTIIITKFSSKMCNYTQQKFQLEWQWGRSIPSTIEPHLFVLCNVTDDTHYTAFGAYTGISTGSGSVTLDAATCVAARRRTLTHCTAMQRNMRTATHRYMSEPLQLYQQTVVFADWQNTHDHCLLLNQRHEH